MNYTQVEEKLKNVLDTFSRDTFVYDLLLAYNTPKSTISRLQKGGLNLAKNPGEILLKKKLFFRDTNSNDLLFQIDEVKADKKIINAAPRFIIITDFVHLVATDTKTQESLDILFTDLPKHFDFFLPWAGMEKTFYQLDNPLDRKAAERMARVYEEIRVHNKFETGEDKHGLNVFLSRLLFCFFAEDTGIFEDKLFSNNIESHTQTDGSDLSGYLTTVFKILNQELAERGDIPNYLSRFPYVNGGLFEKEFPVPQFNTKSRKALIDNGKLDWSVINPDIFGSMIQAVVRSDTDNDNTEHYTSVPNIMKVIKPLFLDELYEGLEKAGENPKKLDQLHNRITKIKIFDPACGSGNFLIIAYKELRKLEMELIKARGGVSLTQIHLNNFYGIELNDFSVETAKLSLWLAEHQMHQEFNNEFGRTSPTLPLKEAGQIIQGNAARVDWEEVCPINEGDEIYVLGNPPFGGGSVQTKEQKEDVKLIFNKDYGNLDYVAIWYYKGSRYINSSRKSKIKLGLVSTNSIVQGEQVLLLWPRVLNDVIEIDFAYQSFKWKNNAKGNAGVTVVIIGLRKHSSEKKIIFKDSISIEVENINPYLQPTQDLYVTKSRTPLSKSFPAMLLGNAPKDGGNLILDRKERDRLLSKYPDLKMYIKEYIGAEDFLRGAKRWCLWFNEEEYQNFKSLPELHIRFEAVANMRLSSKKEATKKYYKTPFKFIENGHPNRKHTSIIVPNHTSERRLYIPMGFYDESSVISNSAQVIYDPEPWIFGVISSRMHMVWVRAVGGRLETRLRYSSSLCYNTFPLPDINDKQKQVITQCVFRIIAEREKFPERILAQLYDPNKMPPDLLLAHQALDQVIDRIYRSKEFQDDTERLEMLFKLYQEKTA